jgi:large subunit ribosomal protein L14e
MPLFRRFVQIGRVVLITRGADEGKLAVIIDIVDENRAFVDGPANITGVQRQTINFKHLSLTDIVIEIPRAPRQATLAKAFKAADVQNKWAKTAWAKKRTDRAKRASLGDFDRFKVLVARKKRNAVIGVEQRKLIKSGNKPAKPAAKGAPAKKK